MAAHAAELHVRADESAAEGHFPGNPIVPGAVLLRDVLRIVAADGEAACSEIRSARFFQPVRPGDRMIVRWDVHASGEIAFTCSTATGDQRVMSGKLRIRVPR
jgi:3-hydroxymyristoyl/3-hydroxydecanoyl-(acyl carrier protein) dehydratase